MTVASGADLPGGLINSTGVVATYQWQVAFKELKLGIGSAMGMVLFAAKQMISAELPLPFAVLMALTSPSASLAARVALQCDGCY